MTRWFTSDTHFGHKNIINFCDRPFKDFFHMDEVLVNNWNNVVAEDDVVFHLGDVALGPWERWDGILTRLNGYKVLVIGNHDRVFQYEREKMRERFTPLYDKWFDETHTHIEGLELDNGLVVNLSHFPYDGDSHGEDRHPGARLADNGVPLVHGHTHLPGVVSRSKAGTNQVHVGVDAHNYTPVSEQQVIDYFRVADDILDADNRSML